MIRSLILNGLSSLSRLYKSVLSRKNQIRVNDLLVGSGWQMVPRRLERLGSVVYAQPSSAFAVFESLVELKYLQKAEPLNLIHLGASTSADHDDPMFRLFTRELFRWHCYEPHPDSFEALCEAIKHIEENAALQKLCFPHRAAVVPIDMVANNGQVEFFVPNSSDLGLAGVSSLDPAHTGAKTPRGDMLKLKVAARSVGDIMDQFSLDSPSDDNRLEVLASDIEGQDIAIITEFFEKSIFPEIILCEYVHSNLAELENLISLAKTARYHITADALNILMFK